MYKLLQSITNYFSPSEYFFYNKQYLRKTKSIVSVNAYLIVLGVTFFYSLIAFYINYVGGLIAIIPLFFISLLCLVLHKKSVSLKITNIIFYIGSFFAVSTTIYFSRGYDSFLITWLVTLPTGAVLITGKKVGLYALLLSCVILFLFYLLSLKGFVFPNQIKPEYQKTYSFVSHLGLIVLLYFVSVFFYNAEETAVAQEILEAQLETQEETFATISQELHDNIGQLLNSTKLLIGITQRKMPNSPDTLNTANDTIANAINELRSLSKLLNKEYLLQFNLIENLQTEIKRINTSKILYVHLTHPNKIFIDNNKQIILFRIVQEALQNAIKHSNATEININITNDKNSISLSIEDNGIGFNNTIKPGMGLANMKQRTKLLGGTIYWNSQQNTGTLINITLPFKN